MKLMEALSKITQADLDECVVAIQGHEKELDQLKELRKIMEVKLGIKKPAGFHLRAGQRKKPAGGGDAAGKTAESTEPVVYGATAQHRIRIKEFLMANGPTSQQDIVRRCGVPAGLITAVLKHEWFAQTDRGIQLTKSLKMEPY